MPRAFKCKFRVKMKKYCSGLGFKIKIMSRLHINLFLNNDNSHFYVSYFMYRVSIQFIKYMVSEWHNSWVVPRPIIIPSLSVDLKVFCQGGHYHYPFFTDGENEAQKGEVTCPLSPRRPVAELGIKLIFQESQSCIH